MSNYSHPGINASFAPDRQPTRRPPVQRGRDQHVPETLRTARIPFSITPTRIRVRLRSHQRALNVLLVAQRHGEGFIKVVGEVGTGKTLLCRRFLSCLPAGTVTAYVPNPSMKPRGLLLTLAHELRLPVSPRASEFEIRTRIEEAMIAHGRAGRPVVICLDEAQTIPLPSLEILRLLSNLETEKSK
jgi:MSHA biogenesis protein MshM